MLTMENVTVTFKDGQDTITALNNATFTARDGEITFIVGESGSGKSTLLSAAAGLITPDSGSILIDAHLLPTNLHHLARGEVEGR